MFGILTKMQNFYDRHLEWPIMNYIHKRKVYVLRKKNKIVVVFYAMNVPMWNYQHLLDLLNNDPRFDVYAVISPNQLSPINIRNEEAEELRLFFTQRHVRYIDCDSNGDVVVDVKKTICPDLVFYNQPYFVAMKAKDYCENYKRSLICYYPYAFWTANGEWSYNGKLHRIAWKCFYSTEMHLQDARDCCFNHGENVVVTGYPKTDDFLSSYHKDVWKIKNKSFKRLIWAPHFTLEASLEGTPPRSNFLMMADLMVDIANEYSEQIQIAFKPHPRLKQELYKLKSWGKERTDKYYMQWDSMPNSFLVEGEYIDLFMTSDAMVHDCSSFSIEYLYSQNPVMYITQDLEAYKGMLNRFGKIAIDTHYIGKNEKDIISFIEKQLLADNDSKQEQRRVFYKKYLVPSHGMKVSEFTYNTIISSLEI